MYKNSKIQEIPKSQINSNSALQCPSSNYSIRAWIFACILMLGVNSYAKDNISLHASEGVAILRIMLDKGEKTYWHHSGRASLPTVIEITHSTNLKNHYIDWPWPEFNQNLSYINAEYKGGVDIPIYLQPKDYSKPVEVNLKTSYVVCGDDGCSKKEANLSVVLRNPKEFPKYEKLEKYSAYIENNKLVIEFELAKNEPLNVSLVDNKNNVYLPDFIEHIEHQYKLMFPSELIKDSKILFLFTSKHYNHIEFNIEQISERVVANNILFYILLAFVGGSILNLMPCVLPVLSMKLFHLLDNKTAEEKRIYSVISTFTIVFYFMLLAILTIEAKELGRVFIPGFSMQQPYAIILCAIIVTIMLSVIRDKIDFTMNFDFLSSLKSKNKYVEIIFSTLASTILATPCTAPFLVTSMTFAITESPIIIFAIFASASVGFSLPYIGLILFPSLLSYIPKSGPWQKKLKFILALMLVATVGWLIWLLNSLLGFYGSLSTFMLIYLLRYCLECSASRNIKLMSLIVIILGFLIIPSSVSKNFDKINEIYHEHWIGFDDSKVQSLIKADKIVFVDITADWCMTCQINKIFVLDRLSTIKLFKDNEVYTFMGDLTKENELVSKFLLEKGVAGIPYNIIYGPNNKNGVVLPVIFSYKDIEDAINLVK